MLQKFSRKIFFFWFFIFIFYTSYSQDLIVTNRGDSLNCKIIGFEKDRIITEVKKNNDVISTYILYEQVDTFYFELIESLRKELDTNTIYHFEFNEGSEIYARIRQLGADELVLESDALGQMIVKVYHINQLEGEKYNLDKKGKYWFQNPNATRYFFAPTAINLEKGTGYYQNVYVLLNMANYGVTDWFSIGGGFEFITTFSPESKPIAFITPKVGFPVGEKLHLGCGFLGGYFAEETAGMFYGLGTYGTLDHNLSIGLGWGFVSTEFQENPFITFSGMARTGRKFSLVTENWFIPTEDYYTIISYGGRFFGPKMSIDIGFLNNSDIIEILPIGIPYVDFVLKF